MAQLKDTTVVGNLTTTGVVASGGLTINGYQLGQLEETLATVQNTTTQTLSHPLSEYSYILLISENGGNKRYVALLPVGYLLDYANNEIRFRFWNSSSVYLVFTSTTVRCTSEYYGYPVVVYGIR